MNVKVVVDKKPESILSSQKIRRQVFVLEQGIPQELDLDGLDEHSYHAIASVNNDVIGVARLALLADNKAVMARVAIIKEYRGKGIATKLVTTLLVKAEQLKICNVELHAHAYLRKYYENFGFDYIKPVEVVGEHQLIQMVKKYHCNNQ